MKVLMLCNKSPFPPLEGGPVAMEATIRGLADAGVRVDVLAAVSYKFPSGPLPDDLKDRVSLLTAEVDLSLHPVPALINLLRNRSYHLARFRSADFSQKLHTLLSAEHYDVVQFETPFLGQYLQQVRALSDAIVILRAHNVESLVWERLSMGEATYLKRGYMRILSRQLRDFEANFAHNCDGIAAITDRDAAWFRKTTNKPVSTYPYGRRISTLIPQDSTVPDPRVFHLGSMNWMPNEEGMAWFLREVWPLVMARRGEMELHLAGRHMPSWLRGGSWPGVFVHGEVPDAVEFMRCYGIMAVPLLSGSGMRIKIIEGMETGRAIVSTSIGAEGINVTDREHLLIADSAEEFAQCLLELAADEGLRTLLGQNAVQRVRETYDNSILIADLIHFYKELIEKKNAAG